VSKKWHCAVVGAGTVGRSHIRVIPQLAPLAKLVAVCDVATKRAQTELEKNNLQRVNVYEDMAKMLKAEPSIEVIHLATPSGAHMDLAIAAMKAGKHVICEKPLEIKLDRVDKMIETADKEKVKLACIFQGRWKDENRAIKQAMEAKRFGKLAWAGCFTPWYRPDKYYEEVDWRGTWALDGGGAVMNQGIHAIDLLQWIAGPVKSVSAYGGMRVHPKIETEDTMSAALEFENGAYGSILCSTALYPGMPTRIEVAGENGTAVSEDGLKIFAFRDREPNDAELLHKLSPANKPAKAPFSGAQSNAASISADLHGRNIHAILSAWAEGHDAETAGPEARKAVAIVLAMYESARQGGAAVKVSN
jgi:predicted dehydrogenase